MEIRRITENDDLVAITALVHSAYAPHAAAGLRYWGTHQTVEDTGKRIRSGTAFVIVDADRYCKVVVIRPPRWPSRELMP